MAQGALGVVRAISNAEMVQAEQESARKSAEAANEQPLMQGLAKYVMDCWTSARDAKALVTERLLKAQRARSGQYDLSKLAAIQAQAGGSTEYARVTANKCRVAEAWLRDVYLGQNESPFTLSPTPVPSFPPDLRSQVEQQVGLEIAQVYATTGQMPPQDMVRGRTSELMDAVDERLRDEARLTTERMQRKMEDQLDEGNFHESFGDFLADLVTYPAAHFKGPILRKKPTVQWATGPDGSWTPQIEDQILPEFERIDPFKCYPAPDTVSPQEGYFIEHIQYRHEDLYNLIGVPGFNEEAIRAALDANEGNRLSNWLGFTALDEKRQIDGSATAVNGRHLPIDCLEFHGAVKGSELIDWGLEASEVSDPDKPYEACVWLVGRWVIKAQLNYNPLGTRPYYKTSFEELPGAYWGFGLCDLLEDVQGVVNAAVRSLVNNMAVASGPQVGINVDRLAAGEEITSLTPWRIWQFEDNPYGTQQPPLQFFQPQSNVQDILTVLEKFYQFADDFSLVPRYMGGSEKVGGAGRTASGLSMLMGAASKGLKGIVSNVDMRVVKPLLEHLYMHNMLYDTDPTLKGDAQVVARGAVSLMQLESLQLRRNEFLQATANPIDAQIVGLDGRRAILREVAKGLEMDVNKVVPRVPQQPGGAPAQPQSTPQAPPGEQLMNGQAVTDNFSPNALRSAV